jgi:CIC family chloride channel protein
MHVSKGLALNGEPFTLALWPHRKQKPHETMPERSPQPNVHARESVFLYPPRFWLLVVLSGAGAGLGGGLLMRLLHTVQHLSYSYKASEFLSAVARSSPQRRVLVLLGAGIIAAVVRLFLKAAPGTGGDLSESLWFRSGKMPFVRTLIRAVLSIVIVGMGVSLGREGAPKETGAAIASKLCDWFNMPSAQRRLLVACAAGAGMASAYNVPFSGAIFAVEVLLGTLALPLLVPAMVASLISAAVSWLLIPDRPTYVIPHYALHLPDIAWAALASPLLGLGAVVWIRFITWADTRKSSGWKALVTPALIFTALGAVAIFYPDILGNGKGVVQRAYLDHIGLTLLLPLLFLKLIAPPACLSTGVPGGLFTPTLTFGALLGGVLGHFWAMLGPAFGWGTWPGSDLGVFAILGSAAMLAAATEGPISSVAFVIELTRHVDALMVPMLLTIAGASLVAQRLENRSIYSARVKAGLKGAEKRMLSGTAFDRYGTDKYALATTAALFSTISERLLRDGEPMFVIDNEKKFVGEITREDAIHAHPAGPRAITSAADLAHAAVPIVASASERDAVAQMMTQPGRALAVIDSAGKWIGAGRVDPNSE